MLLHDHVLLRQGLRRLLEDEADIEVVSEAENAATCLRRVHELQPDVLIADAATFGLAAAEAEIRVAQESSNTKIVFLNMQEQASPRLAGLRVEAADYAGRQTSSADLVEMVRGSWRGSGIHHRPTGDTPPSDLSANQREAAQPQPLSSTPTMISQGRALTAREREVMKLLAEGKTVRAAATVLGLSSKTVDAHKFNLMRKLGIHNKAELVMWAIRKRVVKMPANF
jgi:DNA-binding NarL/FixJ family response regulator